MNQEAVLKILQDNGARPTPENINRLMQSSEMYGRALGLQGGMDESGPTPLMLDKLMQATSTPSQMPVDHEVAPQQEARPGRVEVGTPTRVAAPASPNRQMNYGPAPGPAPNRQMNYSAPPSAASGSVPSTGSGNNPNVLDGSATTQMANQKQGEYSSHINWNDLGIGNGLGWLAALLGVSAAARPGAPPVEEMKRLPAPDPKLTDQSGPKMPSGAPVITNKDAQRTKGMAQTPEEIAALKAQVDAENAAIEASRPTEMGESTKPKKPNKTGAQETVDAVKQFRKLFAK
jgi:hypothetical protein